MKKVLLLLLVLATAISGSAQQRSKLSAGTRLVLSELQERQAVNTRTVKANGKKQTLLPSITSTAGSFAKPFVKNGKTTISCWIKLSDTNFGALTSISGVEVIEEIKDIAVCNVAIDALDKVTALNNVVQVNIDNVMESQSYDARYNTNVDDILTHSADAVAAGLEQAYDGTGVVLGIIDTGIQFNHAGFKDEGGNTRIKLAITYDSDSGELVEHTGSAIDALTTDGNSAYHGSHTSFIAGGSPITINAYYYDMQQNKSVNGTRVYGGMAPGTDLVLCGLAGGGSTDSRIAACIKRISEYADEVGKPCVINLSLGSHYGAHDGKNVVGTAVDTYMSGPGKIMCIAAGNQAGKDEYKWYNYGTASANDPVYMVFDYQDQGTVTSGSNTLNNMVLNGYSYSYVREKNVPVYAQLFVYNSATNTIAWASEKLTDDTSFTVNSSEQSDENYTWDENLAGLFEEVSDGGGHIKVLFSTDAASGKTLITTDSYYLRSKIYSTEGTTYTGNLYIGLAIEPVNSGDNIKVDTWGKSSTFFKAGSVTYGTETATFAEGTTDCSVTDVGSIENAIIVGGYNSTMSYCAATGTGSSSRSYTGSVLDVYKYSSYALASSPTERALPDITAPAYVIAAGNKYQDLTGNNYVVRGSDSENPLLINSGTSMAAPVVAGIAALWLQMKPDLTVTKAKEILASSAISDELTQTAQSGPNGRADALAGASMVLGKGLIVVDKQELTWKKTTAGTYTETFTVKGANLLEDITLKLYDGDGVYSIDKTTITKAAAQGSGTEVTVTYQPTGEGEHLAKITLSSKGCADVDVVLVGGVYADGTAKNYYLDMSRYATIDEVGWTTSQTEHFYIYTPSEDGSYGWVNIPVYSAYYNSRYEPKHKWLAYGSASTLSGSSWNAWNQALGSKAFYGDLSGRAYGLSPNASATQTATTEKYVEFYVSGVEEVQLYTAYGYYQTSSYPSRVRAYECTEAANKTVTKTSTYTQAVNSSKSSSSTSTAFGRCTLSNLDPTKIYCIRGSIYRANMREIAFKVPNTRPRLYIDDSATTVKSLNITATTEEDGTASFRVYGENLKGNITLNIEDEAGVFSLDRYTISPSEAGKTTSSKTLGKTVKAAGDGQLVTVTLDGSNAGDFEGTVVMNSEGMVPTTVKLIGTVDPITGIVEIVTETETAKGPWYTLQGVRLNKAPQQKGVYILNGKKVLVK